MNTIPIMSPSRPLRRAGFSLIEVMVAVFILAVAVVGLTRGITTALGSSKDAELFSQAVQLAANRIEFLRADGVFRDGETEGTVGGYKWRQVISTTQTAGLHEVRVEVEPPSGGDPIYTLRTLLYQTPTEAPETRNPKGKDNSRDRRRSRKAA
jgi:prepilin-type N-terminal cleavage/methylation domain-containing protein